MSNIDIATEAIKAAPPVAVTGLTWWGVSIADWVAALTIIYLVMQMVLLLPKYSDWYRRRIKPWVLKRVLRK